MRYFMEALYIYFIRTNMEQSFQIVVEKNIDSKYISHSLIDLEVIDNRVTCLLGISSEEHYFTSNLIT